MTKILGYLNGAMEIAATSRIGFTQPFTGERCNGSISYVTDGEWVWMDDLSEYIQNFNLAIPNAWLKKMKAHGYRCPQVDGLDYGSLPRPPTVSRGG